jgi:hypothetical protein
VAVHGAVQRHHRAEREQGNRDRQQRAPPGTGRAGGTDGLQQERRRPRRDAQRRVGLVRRRAQQQHRGQHRTLVAA